jgi:hypothetical protein
MSKHTSETQDEGFDFFRELCSSCVKTILAKE